MTHTLGEYLTACRSTTSRREVARRTGLSEGQVRNYESDRVARPNPAALAALARTVNGDVRHTLMLAGLNPDHYPDLLADPAPAPGIPAMVDAHDEWFATLSARDRGRRIAQLVDFHAAIAANEG